MSKAAAPIAPPVRSDQLRRIPRFIPVRHCASLN
jgi:hypothetical protein